MTAPHKCRYKASPEREKTIFDAIGSGAKTRVQLVEETGLSRSMLAYCVTQMLKDKTIYVAGFRRAPGRGPNIPAYAQGDWSGCSAVELSGESDAPIAPPQPIQQQDWCSALFAPPIYF